jgi:hypothetical protein
MTKLKHTNMHDSFIDDNIVPFNLVSPWQRPGADRLVLGERALHTKGDAASIYALGTILAVFY